MSIEQYVMLGYGISIVLIWGYAITLWVGTSALAKKEARLLKEK